MDGGSCIRNSGARNSARATSPERPFFSDFPPRKSPSTLRSNPLTLHHPRTRSHSTIDVNPSHSICPLPIMSPLAAAAQSSQGTRSTVQCTGRLPISSVPRQWRMSIGSSEIGARKGTALRVKLQCNGESATAVAAALQRANRRNLGCSHRNTVGCLHRNTVT